MIGQVRILRHHATISISPILGLHNLLELLGSHAPESISDTLSEHLSVYTRGVVSDPEREIVGIVTLFKLLSALFAEIAQVRWIYLFLALLARSVEKLPPICQHF